MTTLLEVTIDGLAGREERVHYELRRDVNIFFGLNGSGKTSLLKILHSGLENDSASLARVPFNSASIKFFSNDSDRDFVRSITGGTVPSEESARERQYRNALKSVLEEQPYVSGEMAERLARERLALVRQR
jgi:ATPase subunit of ABC transporter with duplicated ATPase domains